MPQLMSLMWVFSVGVMLMLLFMCYYLYYEKDMMSLDLKDKGNMLEFLLNWKW